MGPCRTGEDLVAFYAAFTRSDFEFMAQMIHEDCVLGFPGSSFGGKTLGREAIIDKFRGVQAALNGTLRFECDWAVVIGDRGVVQWYTFGTPAHAAAYRNRGAAIFRFHDGLIIDFQDYLDTEIIASLWPAGVPGKPPAHLDTLLEKADRLCQRQ